MQFWTAAAEAQREAERQARAAAASRPALFCDDAGIGAAIPHMLSKFIIISTINHHILTHKSYER